MFKMLCFNGIQTINNSYTQSCSMREFLKIRRKEIGLNLHEKKGFIKIVPSSTMYKHK